MPPRKREPLVVNKEPLPEFGDVDVTYRAPGVPSKEDQIKGLLRVGQLCNIVNGGRTLQNYEVLAMDDRFIKFRADMSVAPQTEMVLIPYVQIEAIGLVGER